MMSMNKEQKIVIAVFVLLLMPVLGMFVGNYDYSQQQTGQNKQVIKITIAELIAIVVGAWLLFISVILFLLRGDKNAGRTNN